MLLVFFRGLTFMLLVLFMCVCIEVVFCCYFLLLEFKWVRVQHNNHGKITNPV